MSAAPCGNLPAPFFCPGDTRTMTSSEGTTQETVKARPAVVLAAGLGSRLAAEGEQTSAKPLTRLMGVPLLLRTLRSLEVAGCDRGIVVLGHQAERVGREIEEEYRGSLELELVVNPQYRLQNGVSVLAARDHVDGEFVLTMADHIVDDRIMRLVRGHRPPAGGATLCVDYKIDAIFDIDDATKVHEEGGFIRQIGKELASYNCIDTGFFICTPELMEALDRVFGERGDASLSDGIGRLAAAGVMRALDIGDGFWQDVDTPEMLAHAQEVLASRAEE